MNKENKIEKSSAQIEYDKKVAVVASKLGDIETIVSLMDLAIIDSKSSVKDGKASFSRGIFEKGAETRKLDVNGIAMKYISAEAKIEVMRNLVQTLSDSLSPKEVKTKKKEDKLTGKLEGKYV